MGAGRTELAMSIFGNTPGYKIVSGELWLKGKKVDLRSPRACIDAGLAYVTEDRKRNGLILIQDIRFNTTIAALQKLTRGLVVDGNEEIRVANEFKDAINIKRRPSNNWWATSPAATSKRRRWQSGCLPTRRC